MNSNYHIPPPPLLPVCHYLYLRGLEVLGELVPQLPGRVDGEDPGHGDTHCTIRIRVLTAYKYIYYFRQWALTAWYRCANASYRSQIFIWYFRTGTQRILTHTRPTAYKYIYFWWGDTHCKVRICVLPHTNIFLTGGYPLHDAVRPTAYKYRVPTGEYPPHGTHTPHTNI